VSDIFEIKMRRVKQNMLL